MADNKIEFSAQQKKMIADKIRHFFNNELDEPIGDLKAILIFEEMSKILGTFYYNKGVEDTKAYISHKIIEEIDFLYK